MRHLSNGTCTRVCVRMREGVCVGVYVFACVCLCVCLGVRVLVCVSTCACRRMDKCLHVAPIRYGVATISRLLKNIRLFCKRAL